MTLSDPPHTRIRDTQMKTRNPIVIHYVSDMNRAKSL